MIMATKNRSILPWVVTAVVVVAAVLVLACTNPSRQQHVEVATQVARSHVDSLLSVGSATSDGVAMLSAVVQQGGRMMANGYLKHYVDQQADYHDCLLWSVTKMRGSNDQSTVTLGLLGHVWLLDRHPVDASVDKAISNAVTQLALTVGSLLQ